MARRARFVISDLSAREKTDITLQQSGIHNQQSGSNSHQSQANQSGSGQSGGIPPALHLQASANPPLHTAIMNEVPDMHLRSGSQERVRSENTDFEGNAEETMHNGDFNGEESVPISVLNGFQDVLSNKVRDS